MAARTREAVIADMDGVLTRTAIVHQRAWKRMFDDFLAGRGGQRPFTAEDYRAHVDGKPRYDGVADFLASRGIALPRGTPDDGPGSETVCGLGNRKNEYFLEEIDRDGVEVWKDTIAALEGWRREGLKLAAMSASRNCRRILAAARIDAMFDAIVDGQTAAELGLNGKPEIIREAARRLGVAPADAVLLEDATAGVRAGREVGIGHVVGILRFGADDRPLLDAGAHVVVRDVGEVKLVARSSQRA